MTETKEIPQINSREGANEDSYEKARTLLKTDHQRYLIEYIRPKLDDLEDSILFCLFERAKFKKNSCIYSPGQGPSVPREIHLLTNGRPVRIPGLSFLDYLLLGTEIVHATAGRYKHPEEYPYFSGYVPEPMIQRKKKDPHVVAEAARNVTDRIKPFYIDTILRKICKDGDDDEYGSSSEWDIRCLQDLSRRVHLGYNVAEAKFRSDPEGYKTLVSANKFDEIKTKLRDIQREEELIKRVKIKGEIYMNEKKGEKNDSTSSAKQRIFRVDPEIIATLFKEEIIPLTIDIEVDYFIRRVNFPIE